MRYRGYILASFVVMMLCALSSHGQTLDELRTLPNLKSFTVLSHDVLRKTQSKLEFPLVSVQTNMLDSLVLIVSDGTDKRIQKQAAELVRNLSMREGMSRILDARGADDVQIVFANSPEEAKYYDKMLIWGSKRGGASSREFTILYLEGKIPVENLQLNSTIFPLSTP